MKEHLRKILKAAPFNLGEVDLTWVSHTYESLTVEEKIGQLFVLSSMGLDPEEPARLGALKPAGICRFFTRDAVAEVALMEDVRRKARVPLLVAADLEGSRMSLPFGTEVPNPLALAAIDDVEATREISCIMAREAAALGINWSFGPVIDINANFRSAIVATRGFGSDVEVIERHALAQIVELQKLGIAATAKHWPGEGYDDRDQHLVTTINPLRTEEWEATFGRLYSAAIGAGVKSIMSAHIALPAFALAEDAGSGLEAYRPASINRHLNETLLRNRLGFNGLIVSDATGMAGLGSWGPREVSLPEVIENGCDIILFSNDPDADYAIIRQAIASSRISPERLEAALHRTLGLKASLGLHNGVKPVDEAVLGMEHNRATAIAIARRAPTLVKDTARTLPLSRERHKRILVFSTGIVSPIHDSIEFTLIERLAQEGFEITVNNRADNELQDFDQFDLVLYLMGEETLLTRGHIFFDWARLTGNFRKAMQRPWHDVPTILVSFGYPYYLYDAPRMPCVVNAYASMDSMQEVVVECLLGRQPWNANSPVDPFCNLPDAAF